MKSKYIPIFILLNLFFITVVFSGCTVTFTPSDSLQFNLSQPTDKTVSLVADFESGEEDNVSGDVTQKAGSVCAGGACIIY
jgi:hypothetical protein